MGPNRCPLSLVSSELVPVKIDRREIRVILW